MDADDIIERLSRDLKEAASHLSREEARILVDAYYTSQENRIREAAQVAALAKAGEPSTVLAWLARNSERLESQIRLALDKYSAAQPIGVWARAVRGVGPVIASGLIAHIDVRRAETVSDVWSFAGLNPDAEWRKGEKRPWNAALKTLCWKLGESFVKVSNHPESVYGQLYRERKNYEIERNEAGGNAAAAARALEAKRYRADTTARKCYEAGRLPPAQIHARARRYAVKMFLSHFHSEWRRLEGLPVRDPYAVAMLGHGHTIRPEATAKEKPSERERASFEEQPNLDERAPYCEMPRAIERAMKRETPTSRERASRNEKPNGHERALDRETPKHRERAKPIETPITSERALDYEGD